jgi:hypothetical protein
LIVDVSRERSRSTSEVAKVSQGAVLPEQSVTNACGGN